MTPAETVPLIILAILEHQIGDEIDPTLLTEREFYEILRQTRGKGLDLAQVTEVLGRKGISATDVMAGWNLMLNGQPWLQ